MKTQDDPAVYIEPLHVNGMQGRLLYLPPKKKLSREILVIYGHHSSLERWWGLVQNFNTYGAVAMPDLPGFGGMDSFHKIGKQATLDNYADYMAAFIKLRYRRRKVSIVAISFGFLVATRMLQRYPELSNRVELLVSAMGFMHHDNFRFSKARHNTYRYTAEVTSIRPFPFVIRHTLLTSKILPLFYARTHNAKHKFKLAVGNQSTHNEMMAAEVHLWQCNDLRSHMQTSVEMLTVDNCAEKVNVPVWHVYTPSDNYFDNDVIEQQMRVVFSDFYPAVLQTKTHAPSVIATKKEAAAFIPKELRSALRKK